MQSVQSHRFFGPVAAVGGVIRNRQGKVLLLERARDPGRGMLGMPGGFVDPYECAEKALRREVLEEVGADIEEIDYLMTAPNEYRYQGVRYPVLDLFFAARIVDDTKISAEESEVSKCIWVDLTESWPEQALQYTPPIDSVNDILDCMAFESNRKALIYYRSQYRNDRSIGQSR